MSRTIATTSPPRSPVPLRSLFLSSVLVLFALVAPTRAGFYLTVNAPCDKAVSQALRSNASAFPLWSFNYTPLDQCIKQTSTAGGPAYFIYRTSHDNIVSRYDCNNADCTDCADPVNAENLITDPKSDDPCATYPKPAGALVDDINGNNPFIGRFQKQDGWRFARSEVYPWETKGNCINDTQFVFASLVPIKQNNCSVLNTANKAYYKSVVSTSQIRKFVCVNDATCQQGCTELPVETILPTGTCVANPKSIGYDKTFVFDLPPYDPSKSVYTGPGSNGEGTSKTPGASAAAPSPRNARGGLFRSDCWALVALVTAVMVGFF